MKPVIFCRSGPLGPECFEGDYALGRSDHCYSAEWWDSLRAFYGLPPEPAEIPDRLLWGEGDWIVRPAGDDK
jgi:hypothetical protein